VPARSRVEAKQVIRVQVLFYRRMYQRCHNNPDDYFLMASATLTPGVYVVDDDTDVSSDRCDFCLKRMVLMFRRFVANRKIAGKVDCFVLDYKMHVTAVSTWRTGCGTAILVRRTF
jgi:hypothetical protein